MLASSHTWFPWCVIPFCLKLCILSDEDFLLIHPLGMLPFWEMPLGNIFLCLNGLWAKMHVMDKEGENAFAHHYFSLGSAKRLLDSSDKLRMSLSLIWLHGSWGKAFLGLFHCHKLYINTREWEAACYIFAALRRMVNSIWVDELLAFDGWVRNLNNSVNSEQICWESVHEKSCALIKWFSFSSSP